MRHDNGTTRRDTVKRAADALALTAAARAALLKGVFAQGVASEVKGAKLGFVALTDAAPLFVAREKGIFATYGVPETEVMKQASRVTTRGNLVLGFEGNRADPWRDAARAPGVSAIPVSTSRSQETMFDGEVFDPADPDAYLASLGIEKVA